MASCLLIVSHTDCVLVDRCFDIAISGLAVVHLQGVIILEGPDAFVVVFYPQD